MKKKRIIKFRGIRIDNGEWIYGYYLFYKVAQIMDEYRFYYEVYPDSVGEWTGYNDKNDLEIYEDDIIVQSGYLYFDNGEPNYVATVEWAFGGFQIILHCINPEKSGISDGINEPLEEGEEFEIIGNTYQHPELLKVKMTEITKEQ